MGISKETERGIKSIKLPYVPCSFEYNPKGLSVKVVAIKTY